MKCNKCNYTTFDHFQLCPKCSNSFEELRNKLQIVSYILSDENNYLLIDTTVNTKTVSIENTNKTDEKKEESKPVIQTDDSSEPIKLEEHIETFSKKEDEAIELEEIDLGDLLDTNKGE